MGFPLWMDDKSKGMLRVPKPLTQVERIKAKVEASKNMSDYERFMKKKAMTHGIFSSKSDANK